jgi:hypothetical protein
MRSTRFLLLTLFLTTSPTTAGDRTIDLFRLALVWSQIGYQGPADLHPDSTVNALDLLAILTDFESQTTPTPTQTPSPTPTPAEVEWTLLFTDPSEGNFPNLRDIYGRIHGDYFELRVTWVNFDDPFARDEEIGFQMYLNVDCDAGSGCSGYGSLPGMEFELAWSFLDLNNRLSPTGRCGMYALNPDLYECDPIGPRQAVSIVRSAQDAFDFHLPLGFINWTGCIEMLIIMEAEESPLQIFDYVPNGLYAGERLRFP